MSESDIRTILERLATIETLIKVRDEGRLEAGERVAKVEIRVDRLERFVWLALGVALASGVPNVVSLIG